MTCPRCNTINPMGSVACASCGTPLMQGPPGAYPPPPGAYPGQAYMVVPMIQTRTSGMAIAGFVLSFLCGLLGLIFSVIGYNECKKSNGTITGGGLALAGIIISICSMVLGLMIATSK